MLTIRADAWHLRLWRWAHESKTAKPKNLCRYFWFLFFLITVPTIACIALLTGAALLIWLMIANPVTSAIVIAVIAGIVAFITAVVYTGAKIKKSREEEEERLREAGQWPPPPKEPSLFVLWLKAKKQKVCPLIAVQELDD